MAVFKEFIYIFMKASLILMRLLGFNANYIIYILK